MQVDIQSGYQRRRDDEEGFGVDRDADERQLGLRAKCKKVAVLVAHERDADKDEQRQQ